MLSQVVASGSSTSFQKRFNKFAPSNRVETDKMDYARRSSMRHRVSHNAQVRFSGNTATVMVEENICEGEHEKINVASRGDSIFTFYSPNAPFSAR
jgi:hypothetical protein